MVCANLVKWERLTQLPQALGSELLGNICLGYVTPPKVQQVQLLHFGGQWA